MMYVAINNRFIVSVTDNEDAADSLAGDGGSVLSIPIQTNDDECKQFESVLQQVLNEAMLILDNNRQEIELSNIIGMKPKKDLN